MAYIAVTNIAANGNPNSFYLAAIVVSSGNTNTGIEVYADDDATPEQINAAIAEAARDACRANSENIATDAPVMIFGGAVQVV